ncbi:M48 family peptidase [Parashewanella spongiae]|uniref:M48 family peptidase n=1 Tax=Parashewanella spongiae TaxID=342950 RepID=A0A3A6TR79_9GAMM|nr:SprT family zinc-dependent metalloprotease [Parashewanella spongiae]MCL1077276.1 M48 family metallopeptidase [Parashewanella spongiae]RJY18567.1 M48 family peptidase [Parashewanella spongiae]
MTTLSTTTEATEYIDGNGFVAEIKRTKRIKSATITVEEGHVCVVVPLLLENERISKLLKDKNRWIKEKLALHREAQPKSSKQFVSGESFSYLGRNYRLKVHQGNYQPAKLNQGRFVITLQGGSENPELIQDSLQSWYKKSANIKLKQKVKRYAKIIEVEYASVGIKTYRNRWGSCSAEGDITINWKIVMAPNRIVDYVVVHELCHLIHHDHSPKFWSEVERIMPDYAECKDWLKQHGEGLGV